MDFLRKKQTSRRRLGGLYLVLTVAVSAMLGGCAAQQARLSDEQAPVAAQPVISQRLVEEDFAFPSQPPSLKRGKEIFRSTCSQCHAQGAFQAQKVKEDLAYSTPIDLYLLLTTGKAPEVVMPNDQRRDVLPATHPSFASMVQAMRQKDPNSPGISRDDRWAAIFYARYLAGAGDIKAPNPAKPDITVSSVFGGNCAVCHGTRGQADGPLHIGKTGNHELHDGKLRNALLPAPANFQQASRMYNRTDAQIFKYICQGIYPSAMPSWYGNVERDTDTGETIYVFNDSLIWNLVRHVRLFAYNDDLDPDVDPEAASPPPGLHRLQDCQPVPQNRPWTQVMRQEMPEGAKSVRFPPADPVTGGMTFESITHGPAQAEDRGEAEESSTQGRLGL